MQPGMSGRRPGGEVSVVLRVCFEGCRVFFILLNERATMEDLGSGGACLWLPGVEYLKPMPLAGWYAGGPGYEFSSLAYHECLDAIKYHPSRGGITHL